ncbi:MAG: sigma-70 family RNA polymerase sigma factor [Pirellulales bacterium]|nr:sigma-70 family RNA polymerase sigma factor [Pirellulales bacterium]
MQLRAGKPEAWQQLIDLYGPLVYYWCRKFGLQPADAADVFQDVFAAVSAGIGRFTYEQSLGRFRGWLWTIARNKVRDYYRRRAEETLALGDRQPKYPIAEIPEHYHEPPADEADSRQLTSLFHKGLSLVRAEFEEQTWDAFWRVAIERQAVPQAAEELSMSAAAVRQAKSRVLRRLRAVLGELLD